MFTRKYLKLKLTHESLPKAWELMIIIKIHFKTQMNVKPGTAVIMKPLTVRIPMEAMTVSVKLDLKISMKPLRLALILMNALKIMLNVLGKKFAKIRSEVFPALKQRRQLQQPQPLQLQQRLEIFLNGAHMKMLA